MIFFKIISIILFSGTTLVSQIQDRGTQSKTFPALKDSLQTISFSFVGDLMCHSTQFNYARVGEDTFDFKPVFAEVKNLLESADFTLGNLETVIGGREMGYSGYPIFNTPEDFLEGLKFAGFDILITANNHSIDKGRTGVLNTLENVHKYGMQVNGTYTSKRDRDSIRIYLKNGIKLGLLGYTYTFNGDSRGYLISKIDTSVIKNDIANAKKLNPDFIIVYLHNGVEYERKPSISQIELTRKVIEYGADIVIQSHPHVAQKIELFESRNKLGKGFIAYSLGNFISNQRWRYSDTGPILNFEITKNITKDSIYVSSLDYIPTWVFKGQTERGREYIILPSETAFYDVKPDYLTKEDISLMKQSFFDTIEIMEPGNVTAPLLKTLKFDYGEFKKSISNLVLLTH